MAGPLVTRSGADSSLAMIIASVVLPSPGGPDSSTWSGARCRPRAACSTSSSCSLTRRCPPNSASVCGRSADSILRSSRSTASADTSGRTLSSIGYALESTRRAARSRSGTDGLGLSAASGATAVTASSASRADQPSPTRPACTCSRHASCGCSGRPVTVLDGAPILSFSSSTIRWAPFLPMPGTFTSTARSSVATAWRNWSGLSTASAACASLGPTPDAVCSNSNVLFASSSANPYSVSESSRTTIDVEIRASCPGRNPASVPGSQNTCSPTPPTSTTAESTPMAATRPRTNAIIAYLPVPRPRHAISPTAAGTEPGPGFQVRPGGRGLLQLAGHAAPPDLTDRQRERVGGVSGRRTLTELEDPGDHRGHLFLARPPRPGDRGLHLARCVQRDRQPAPGGHHHRHAGRLRRAHHGTNVLLGEHALDRDRVRLVLGDPLLELRLDPDEPLGDVQVR